MQLVLDTNGIIVKVRNAAFWIISKTQQRTISPTKITSIAITQDCLLSSAAIRLAVKHQIPITFFNTTGKPQAQLWSPYFGSIAAIRRQQIFFLEKPQATQWIISLFRIKAAHQIQNLQWLLNRKPGLRTQLEQTIATVQKLPETMQPLADQLPKAVQNSLMGIEGAAARAYWQAISTALPPDWQFTTRSRRPALDNFNAALNYLYGMLYSTLESALFAAGLDPHLGILHSDEYNRPTLSFDMIEPFRPWIDRLLLELILEGKLTADAFESRDGGIFVARKGKEILIPAFNERMLATARFQEQDSKRRNHINRFVGTFAQKLLAQDLYNEPVSE